MAAQLCVAVLKKSGKLQLEKLDFLIRGPRVTTNLNLLKDWLPDSLWTSVQALKVPLQI